MGLWSAELGAQQASSFRYPLAREGVYAPDGPACLAHAMHRVINIVGLSALWTVFLHCNHTIELL